MHFHFLMYSVTKMTTNIQFCVTVTHAYLLAHHVVCVSHLSSAYCQDVHLLKDHVVCVCACVCVCVCVMLCCQDVTSFASILPRYHIFRQIVSLACFILCCQDVSSFCSVLPRCPIFWQHTAKMHIFRQHTAKISHFSVDHVVCVCGVCVCVCVCVCHSVLSRSFVSILPRCSIFW